jgi:protocatechuate 3,4-dioxygenase, beta subunit
MKSLYPIIVFFQSILFYACGQTVSSNQPATMHKDLLDIPSKIKIVSESEEGEAMIISGTIYLPDGKTPAKDAVLSVWQTDAKGYYFEKGKGASQTKPRIRGRMKTGTDGKYEFRTIKPAQYPSHTDPAHVHAHVSAPDFPEYGLVYYFEGDDLITDKSRLKLNDERGGTPSIILLTRDSNGVLKGRRDIILEYVKPSGETMKLEW